MNRFPCLMAVLAMAVMFPAARADDAEPGFKGSRPNVVFFLADDQSRFHHRAYGHPSVPTPTTEALAGESLVFDNAFTGQAVCGPSRSMLYTGLYPVRNGCFINHSKVRKEVETLPERLAKLGYQVILAGKSHVGPPDKFPWSTSFRPVEKEGMPRAWIPIKEIDGFLANPGPKPFCLVVASEFPHLPLFEDTPYSADEVVLPPFEDQSVAKRKETARYYRNVAEKEKELAAVLKLLEKHDQADESIVFYADDHGLGRGKFTAYDSGLGVAFMVRWPGRIKPGRTSALTSFADFMPTMIELAGGSPEGLDGKSLLPVFADKDADQHDYVYGVTVNQGIIRRHVFPQRSVRDRRYRYIRNFNSLERIQRLQARGEEVNFFLQRGAEWHRDLPEEMLFDTEADPHEMRNLAKEPELAGVRKRLRTELFRWMKEQNDYLGENGPVPFLDTRRFSLDQRDGTNPIPEAYVGTLKGMKIHPHRATASKR